ncbi:MAG: hypothetical protein RIQ60_2772 [Pseudomonadota bacterium]|jgi:putative two-component system response regulator
MPFRTVGPVLVVDDEPSNLAVMRSILSHEHKLVFASSGQAALDAVAKHQPALILLDLEMPGMDGYAVCRALKADPATADLPVIFVTGHDGVENETAGFDLGAVDYIAKPVRAPIVRARVRTHLQLVRASALERAHRDAISMLGLAGHYNDNDTGLHIWRMASYARALARAAGWSDAAARELEAAAPMHDTGKMGIPGHILRKPGPLDADEWVVMRTHTTIGYGILNQSKAPLFRLAAEIALRHHEKWDGSGYPDGLAGAAIPESARIVAIADVFDALTMKRPYKEPWPVERAVAQLQSGAGSHLDPRLVDLFVSILPEVVEIKRGWEAREQEREQGRDPH